MSDLYIETTIGIDGKKYKEFTRFGYDFLSKHKPQCRQKNKDGSYSISSYDVKESGEFFNICKVCKYKVKNNSWHFPEDEIHSK